MPPQIESVIFDLGDTLLRHESFDPIAGNERLLKIAEPGHNIALSEIQALASAMDKEIARRADEPELLFEFSCQRFTRTLYETLGVSFTLDYPKLEEEFWSASMSFEPAEGIFDVLDLLKTRGIRACVLSNAAFSGTVLENELRRHRMLDYFDFVLSSCDYGFRKPNPFFFRVALAKLGVAPAAAWMVGDKVEFDVVGARNTGIRPFWYNPKGLENPLAGDCVVLAHWGEFAQEIAEL